MARLMASTKHPFPGGTTFTDEEIEGFLTFLLEGAMMKGVNEAEYKATNNTYRIITQLLHQRNVARGNE